MESGVRVEIRDSGTGIDPDCLERIWDPEFTTKSSGTGLGLPMALQTIRFHHGRIEGRNHPEGGAVFLVELPVTRDLETPSPDRGEAGGVV
jgi:signal transduction histidine kinase